MTQAAEPEKKLTLSDRVEEFSKKTYEQAEARKIVVRNLKGFVHKVVRIRRKNHLHSVVLSSAPLGMMQPGGVSKRRAWDTDWQFADVVYNECGYHEDFPELVGMVVSYEVVERDDGGSAYLIVASPGDRFEYRFNIHYSEIEVLDDFPPNQEGD